MSAYIDSIGDINQNTEKAFIRQELWTEVKKNLYPIEFEVIYRLFVENKTMQEVSALSHMSISDVIKIKERAIGKLRTVIDKDYMNYV